MYNSDELNELISGWENSTWLDNLYIQRTEYADNLRAYSESQVDLWRKIPQLAFYANGRNGWQDNWSRAYQHKIWAISSSTRGGYFTVFVDLNTGKLVNISYNNNFSAAQEGCIIQCNPAEFDARKEIDYLRKRIDEPVGDYFKSNYEEHLSHEKLVLG